MAAALIAGCAGGPFAALQIVMPDGVTPHTQPAQLEEKALALIRGMEEQAECRAATAHVTRMTLVDIADARRVEPAAPGQTTLRRGLMAWIVRAEGTFTSRRGRRGGIARPCIPSGYFMFLDRDGTMLAMGYP